MIVRHNVQGSRLDHSRLAIQATDFLSRISDQRFEPLDGHIVVYLSPLTNKMPSVSSIVGISQVHLAPREVTYTYTDSFGEQRLARALITYDPYGQGKVTY